ncbi:MAG: DNA-binding response regulator, partial [Chloroflexota bacterium]
MTTADALDRGRESFGRRAWAEAHAQLVAADQQAPLQPEDLERLAVAADLVGRNDDCADALTRAHHEFLRLGDPARAVQCAFWLGMNLVGRGEMARGGGWFARARRILDDSQQDCVEQGYLLVPVALQSLDKGDAATAYDTFGQAAALGDRFGDRDLMTLGRLGRGQALIQLERAEEGVALFDEVMV